MSNVLINMFLVDMLELFYRPEELEYSFFFNGLHSDEFSQILGLKSGSIPGRFDIFVEDFFKVGNKLLFHFLYGKAGT